MSKELFIQAYDRSAQLRAKLGTDKDQTNADTQIRLLKASQGSM